MKIVNDDNERRDWRNFLLIKCQETLRNIVPENQGY